MVRLRQNRTMVSAIGASTECESRWDEKLSEIVWGINHCVSASTGYSPALSHGSGVVEDLLGDAQESVMVEGGGDLPRHTTGGRSSP